jgi:O-methyltransferase
MTSFYNKLSQMLRRFFNFFGVNVYKTRKTNLAGLSYEAIKPLATYAPWSMDPSFQNIYEKVKNHTFVDQYRCYELWSLVEQSRKSGVGALIEVGVWRGGSGAIIAHQAQKSGFSDPVYLCDTFSGVAKAGAEEITFYKGGEHADTSVSVVEKLTRTELGLDNIVILKGIFPEETAHLILNEQFRFCHIDVDTYQSAKDVFEWIWNKLVVGGIIVFDDYGFKFCEGVTKFVDEIKFLPDHLFIHNLNGHAILIKTHD